MECSALTLSRIAGLCIIIAASTKTSGDLHLWVARGRKNLIQETGFVQGSENMDECVILDLTAYLLLEHVKINILLFYCSSIYTCIHKHMHMWRDIQKQINEINLSLFSCNMQE